MNLFEYESHDTWKPSGNFALISYIILLCIILIFWLFAGAIVTKSIIRQMPGFLSSSPTLQAKMALYQSLKQQNHVFVGSSRIHRQIAIDIIERECVTTAYNFGIGGHDSSNSAFILNWLLERKQRPEKIWLETIGAEQFRSLDKPLRQFYAPFWPNSIWTKRNIDAATKAFKSPLKAHFFIFQNSLKSTFSMGIASDFIRKSSTANAEQGAITNDGLHELGIGGYRPLDEKLVPVRVRFKTNI